MQLRRPGRPTLAIGSLRRIACGIEHRLPLLYLFWALLLGSVLAWIIPPWQHPDEKAHLARATQIALGGFLGQRFAQGLSGVSDPAIARAQAPLAALEFHPERKVTRAMLAAAEAVRWGRPAPLWFPNTVVYPPFLYAAAVPAVLIGRLSHMHVVATLRLVRLFNVIATAALGAMALATARRTRLAIAAMLFLPQSLALAASASEDTIMLVLVALGVAAIDGAATRRAAWIGAIAACLLAAMLARPPYAPLAALLLLLPLERRRLAGGLALSLVAICAGWTIYSTVAISVRMVPSDPLAQLAFVATHPLGFATVLLTTVETSGRWYIDTMIGVLGWLDVWLPRGFLDAARWVLALVLLSAAIPDPSIRTGRRWLAFASALAAAGAVFASLYLIWTPVQASNVAGVQGRYFLPLLPVLALGAPSFGAWMNALRPISLLSVLALAVATPPVTIVALVSRYYLS